MDSLIDIYISIGRVFASCVRLCWLCCGCVRSIESTQYKLVVCQTTIQFTLHSFYISIFRFFSFILFLISSQQSVQLLTFVVVVVVSDPFDVSNINPLSLSLSLSLYLQIKQIS